MKKKLYVLLLMFSVLVVKKCNAYSKLDAAIYFGYSVSHKTNMQYPKSLFIAENGSRSMHLNIEKVKCQNSLFYRASVGYKISEKIRLSLEFLRNNGYKIDKTRTGSLSLERSPGNTYLTQFDIYNKSSSNILLFNIQYFLFNKDSNTFSPYLLAGIGGSTTKNYYFVKTIAYGARIVRANLSRSMTFKRLSYQFGSGVIFQIWKKFKFDIAYRYTFSGSFPQSIPVFGKFGTSNIMLGVLYEF